MGHSTHGREYVLVGWLFLMQYMFTNTHGVSPTMYTGNTPCKYEIIIYNKKSWVNYMDGPDLGVLPHQRVKAPIGCK